MVDTVLLNRKLQHSVKAIKENLLRAMKSRLVSCGCFSLFPFRFLPVILPFNFLLLTFHTVARGFLEELLPISMADLGRR